MEDDFKKSLADNVVTGGMTDGIEHEDIETAIKDAAQKFEEELNNANNGEVSPIMDLKLSKEQEAKLRDEIKRALKDKVGEIEKEERSPEVETVEKDDVDEMIVETSSEEKTKAAPEVVAPKGYLAKLEKLHQMKMKMYMGQVEQHKANPDEELFYNTIKYEKYVLSLRSKYTKEEQQEVAEYEDRYKQEEMAAQRKVRNELNIKVHNFDELVTELKEINDEIEYVQHLQLQSTDRDEGKITEEDAKHRLIIANQKKTKVLADISVLNPQLLIEEREQKHQMDATERNMVGSRNMAMQNNDMSAGTKQSSKFIEGQQNKAEHTLKSDFDYYKKQLQRRNQENRYKYNELKNMLNDLPENPVTADDIKKKANILSQMQEVNTQIEQGEKLERNLDNNMDKNSDEIGAFLAADEEYTEGYQKREEQFREVDEYVTIVEEQEGEEIVEKPIASEEKEEERDLAEFGAGVAAGMAISAADSGDVPAAVGCALISSSLVRDVNNYDDAKEYLNSFDKSNRMKKEREQAQNELAAAEKTARS